jgi:hypothetical protein
VTRNGVIDDRQLPTCLSPKSTKNVLRTIICGLHSPASTGFDN